jgi:hypothetical protein
MAEARAFDPLRVREGTGRVTRRRQNWRYQLGKMTEGAPITAG